MWQRRIVTVVPLSFTGQDLLNFLSTDNRSWINFNPRVPTLFCQRLVAWRDSDNLGMEVRQDFWGTTIGRYTKQPIKKRFEFPRVSLGDQPLTKKPGDTGIETGHEWTINHNAQWRLGKKKQTVVLDFIVFVWDVISGSTAPTVHILLPL